jgi:hypothetical protein
MKLRTGELPKATSLKDEPVGERSYLNSGSGKEEEYRQTPHVPYTADLATNLFVEPNPAEAQVGLRFGLHSDARVTIEVFDALQRLVLLPMKKQSLTQGMQTTTFSVGMLDPGAYYITHLTQ